MITELKTIILFFSSAISSFSFYYHPIFTIIGVTLIAIAVVGLLIVFTLNLKEKHTEKKVKKFKLETEEMLEEIKKNREKIEEK